MAYRGKRVRLSLYRAFVIGEVRTLLFTKRLLVKPVDQQLLNQMPIARELKLIEGLAECFTNFTRFASLPLVSVGYALWICCDQFTLNTPTHPCDAGWSLSNASSGRTIHTSFIGSFKLTRMRALVRYIQRLSFFWLFEVHLLISKAHWSSVISSIIMLITNQWTSKPPSLFNSPTQL